MSARPEPLPDDEVAELREYVASLEARISALEAALAGAAASFGAMKTGAAVSAPTVNAAGKTEAEKIPWLVISAAVGAVVQKPFRIAGIQLQGMPPLNVWAFEGRRAIFYSHGLRSN